MISLLKDLRVPFFCIPAPETCGESFASATPAMDNDTSSAFRFTSKPCRSDYGKSSTRVENVVMHYCDESGILFNTRKINISHWLLYKPDGNVTKHVFELLRVIDREGTISNYCEPVVGDVFLRPFDNVFLGHHVDFDMIAQILVDKYQYSISLGYVVDRFKKMLIPCSLLLPF